MVKIKPEFLLKNGRREFVILTARDAERAEASDSVMRAAEP